MSLPPLHKAGGVDLVISKIKESNIMKFRVSKLGGSVLALGKRRSLNESYGQNPNPFATLSFTNSIRRKFLQSSFRSLRWMRWKTSKTWHAILSTTHRWACTCRNTAAAMAPTELRLNLDEESQPTSEQFERICPAWASQAPPRAGRKCQERRSHSLIKFFCQKIWLGDFREFLSVKFSDSEMWALSIADNLRKDFRLLSQPGELLREFVSICLRAIHRGRYLVFGPSSLSLWVQCNGFIPY